METLTNSRAAVDPPAASLPRWVLLNHYVSTADTDPSVADVTTAASSCTSSGLSFSVSFAPVATPATSRFYCYWIGGAPDEFDHNRKDLRIIAAHDDVVLIRTSVPDSRSAFCTNDYFLYETGSAARPPLLSLLPCCDLDMKDTGVLRRGEGEVIVAQLVVMYDNEKGLRDTAEICVLRQGGDWDLKQLPIVHHEGSKLPKWPRLDAVIPVGIRFMCWVDYASGLFVCDITDTSPEVIRYIALPVPPPESSIVVATTTGLIGPTAAICFAFNVTTWTLNLRTEGPIAWVKDGVLDCDELWQLPNYGCLPRVAPKYPIISSDNPDIICFVICEKPYLIDDDDADETEWMLQINTRSKELLSVVRGDTNPYIDSRLPAKLRWQQ
ncbi:unnamed protein product [Urochloa decumbens]|uniref:DUF1618 domain-containing protein n=1 Tax=Urochloa decumbens TaxID=240449 RepID=A0ABC9B6N3_9POAL